MEEKLFVAEVYDFVAENSEGVKFKFDTLEEVRIKYEYGLKLVELVTGEVDIDLFNFIYGKQNNTEEGVLFNLTGEGDLRTPLKNGDYRRVPVIMKINKAFFIKHKMLTDCKNGTTGNRLTIVLEVRGDMNMYRKNSASDIARKIADNIKPPHKGEGRW